MGVVRVTGKGRRWLAGGHPWLYRDDVAETDAEPGDVVLVLDPAEKLLGYATFSARSKIALRFVSRGAEKPDREFWRARVARAIAVRDAAGLLDPRGACRLLAGDADGFPGLVVDRYATTLVVQSGTLSADRMRDDVTGLVVESLPFRVECVFDRSDAAARKLEGLEPKVEVVQGELASEIVVREDDLEYAVDVRKGHKTGHYLDQRENRRRAALHARDRDVLDAFAYDGLFGIRAALAGARSVVCVDQSREALERGAANAARNRVADRVRFERANCMHDLRERAESNARFGLVIVDPPAFARNRREIGGAERGYVELNRRALASLDEGGMLVSASCSYNVKPQDFVAFLARAAHAAGREAYLEEMRGAGPDHPHLLTLPESAYLKCAFVRAGSRTSSSA
jgi:23S rRNA (cytosine1962-C5)-methyltransferase